MRTLLAADEMIDSVLRADNTTVTWQEYYDLTADPWTLDNLLVTDPNRVPDGHALSAELRRQLTCAGTSGANPCP